MKSENLNLCLGFNINSSIISVQIMFTVLYELVIDIYT